MRAWACARSHVVHVVTVEVVTSKRMNGIGDWNGNEETGSIRPHPHQSVPDCWKCVNERRATLFSRFSSSTRVKGTSYSLFGGSPTAFLPLILFPNFIVFITVFFFHAIRLASRKISPQFNRLHVDDLSALSPTFYVYISYAENKWTSSTGGTVEIIIKLLFSRGYRVITNAASEQDVVRRKGEDTESIFHILPQRTLKCRTARYTQKSNRVHVRERKEENSISRIEIFPIQLDISRIRKGFRIRRNIPRNEPLCRRMYDFRPRSRYSYGDPDDDP